MERERRASNSSRDYFWENPCDYNESGPRSAIAYTPEDARRAAVQAKNAFDAAAEYKDKFAYSTHSYHSYEELLSMWETYKWLRELPWFREEVLPAEKAFNRPVADEYLSSFVKKGDTKLDEILPVMYKALKMVVASLDAMDRDGVSARPGDFSPELRTKITQTKYHVRKVLCHFSDILTSRNLPQESLKLDEAEIPDFKEGQLDRMLIVYRDSLDYLEYLSQVFQKMYEEKA